MNIVPERLIQVVLNTGDDEVDEKNLRVPNIQVNNWKMSINWTEWTDCDRCNDRGEKKRIGLSVFFSKFKFNS